jgi:hypothetical protein
MVNQKKIKPKKPKVPLMELYAYNATIPSRQLLRKHGVADAIGYLDLQQKLTDLYQSKDDKITIEKEFAEIHPHKDFILKYLSPPPVVTTVKVAEPISAAEGTKTIDIPTQNIQALNPNILVASVAMVAITGLIIYAIKK